ncbi:MAG: class I SAM-dependent methyltransferase [Polyangiaceae bacterium]
MVDQDAYWNGPPAERWIREQSTLDAMLRPFGDAALDAARVAAGELALDVGCGCGDTSLALADRVGASGRVVGVDLSVPMLARARERATGRSNLSFLEGDASRVALEARAFDLVYSRFGVMFFPDPTGGFTHLRSALRPNGRVAFVCWRPVADNPWAALPFEAVVRVLGRPEPAPADAPGPFSFGDADRVRRILEGAAFRDVTIRSFDGWNSFGASGSPRDAASELARLGPVARLLADRDEADVAKAVAAIEAVVAPRMLPQGGVRFPAATWVVTAANGG